MFTRDDDQEGVAGLLQRGPSVLQGRRRAHSSSGPLAESLARWLALDVIWLQLGVRHDAAAAVARARGVTVVQDSCPKIEYQRLFGELRMGGFNTGVISSRLT